MTKSACTLYMKKKEAVMYSLYPLGLLAGILLWAMFKYMDKDAEVTVKKVPR